jgi:hypothetical protein
MNKGEIYMSIVDMLTKILKEKHGDNLNLRNDVYYLFLKGGLFSLYYDEDEDTIKANIEFLPEDRTFVYFSDEDLVELVS